MAAIEFSTYQRNLFNAIENSNDHLMVSAVAGSGKTFSLLECMKRIKGTSLFVAFNKAIATELSSKVPSHVTAQTLHSFGFAALRNAFKFVKVESGKLGIIFQKTAGTSFLQGMTNEEKSQVFKIRQQVSSLISVAKNSLIDIYNNEQVATAAAYYNVQYDDCNLGIFRSVMQKSIEMTNLIDFDDMIYLPVILNLPLTQFDNLFVDECQDLNKAQIELVLRMVKKPNGRIIAVGDPRQSIYGFRGADTEAMPRLKEVLKAKELPLSVCYRCPSSHIELAKDIVSHIEAAPCAKVGTVSYVNDEQFMSQVDKDVEPLVLCRTNAPLVSIAIKMIKNGLKAHVKGSDIASFVKNLVINLRARTILELEEKITEWESNQLEMLCKRQASQSVKDTICDYADIVREFAKVSRSPYDITFFIDKVFSEDKAGITLSTVHKAKGLEANNVYIVRPDLLPLVRKGQQQWEKEQEENLHYVALTRSKDKLVFVANN